MLITNQEMLKGYRTGTRLWQGIPSIERTKNGRFFYAFYAGGTKEEIGNYVLLYACREGETCDIPVAVTYREGSRCFDPCLWIDPLGRLWFIWSMMPEDAVYASLCERPDEEALSFSKPFRIAEGVMMNKPTVLSTGEWLFPITSWHPSMRFYYAGKNLTLCGAFAYKTVDNGKTFTCLGGADIPRRSFDEHMLLEQEDGRLSMFIRTHYGIGLSESYDRGAHWCEGRDSRLGGPSSRFHIRRLPSGRILLINHYQYQGRNNLTALLSEDDGKTYPHTLLLDERASVSYPDVATDEEGNLYVIYDRERGGFLSSLDEVYSQAREVLVARVTEADILAGKLVSPTSYLSRVISKLGKYEKEQENPFGEYHRYSNDELATRLLLAHKGEAVVQAVFDAYPPNCVNRHHLNGESIDRAIAALAAGGYTDHALLCSLIDEMRRAYETGSEWQPVVERTKQLISQHLAEPITLSWLAGEIGISMHYLCHLFKKATGTTIVSYMQACRMSHAKQLLLTGEERISEIAARCGFDGASYFTEVFTAAEGISPSEYRRLHK